MTRSTLNVYKVEEGHSPSVEVTVKYRDASEALRALDEAYQNARRRLLPMVGQHPQVDSRTY
jgi:hypothetical protein